MDVRWLMQASVRWRVEAVRMLAASGVVGRTSAYGIVLAVCARMLARVDGALDVHGVVSVEVEGRGGTPCVKL